MNINLNILIPMAGLGSRFQKTHPNQFKPFIDVNGKAMIERVIENNNQLDNSRFIFITRKELPIYNLEKICKNLNVNYEIISIDYLTEGSACTCLLAEKYINNDIPLVITNCDQITEDLNIQNIIKYSEYNNSDGILGVFNSISDKNSYVKLNSNFEVIEIKEKVVISNIATNGFHFWKHGSFFVNSAKSMIQKNERYNNEFYVAPTYNHLIKSNKKIHPYYFNMHFPIGTPEDLNKYILL
jgi:choline kinase